jgi:hypothetical protein
MGTYGGLVQQARAGITADLLKGAATLQNRWEDVLEEEELVAVPVEAGFRDLHGAAHVAPGEIIDIRRL